MNYRNKKIWIGTGGSGTNEILIYEGTVNNRNWAVIKSFKHNNQFNDIYKLRIDISEWRNVYGNSYYTCYSSISKYLHFDKPINNILYNFTIENSSPGWWDNGFSAQLCLSTNLFIYRSEEDYLKQVIEFGFDYSSLNYNDLVEKICDKIQPIFDIFSLYGKPAIPYIDDF